MVEILTAVRKEKSYELRKFFTDSGVPYVAWNVKGRGKEGGFKYRGFIRKKILLPFLPKTLFCLWCKEEEADALVKSILEVAHTGAYGDGKIFLLGKGGSVMKLVKAVLRPEKVPDVIRELEKRDIKAMTLWDVFGRGKEGGLQAGETFYDELAKTMVMVAVEVGKVGDVIEALSKGAHTGAYGDGKVFVMDLSEVWTIRTKSRGL